MNSLTVRSVRVTYEETTVSQEAQINPQDPQIDDPQDPGGDLGGRIQTYEQNKQTDQYTLTHYK